LPASHLPPAGSATDLAAAPAHPIDPLDPNKQFHIDSCSTLHGPDRPAPCTVLVLYAHPGPRISRVNRRLAQAAAQIDGVWVNDLYETYPDFFIDVARERKLVAGAHTVVLVYPTEWYACPALLKEWFDVVLGDAWQRDRFSVDGGPRRCWLATTTGAAAADFAPGRRHGRPFDDYLAPLQQTAQVCGMDWLEPLVLHAAHEVDGAAVDAHVERFAARLRALAGQGAQPLNLGAAHGN
jgi:glutathione-regulated potassium-efflux system ancillary protein KefF